MLNVRHGDIMNITRRIFFNSTVLTGISLFLANYVAVGEHISSADTPVNPDIVIVLTDDLGYGDVSFLNAKSKIKTPHMDALSSQGVWATDAHSPSSICSPTRYALLTGRYAWRGKLRRGVLMPWDEPAIEKGRLTLPSMLRTKGYTTACIGKSVRTEMIYHSGSGALGLRQGKWVYLRMGGKQEPDWYKKKLEIESTDAPGLLFDLSADEGEKVNLYHKQAERVKAMEAKLSEMEESEYSR